MPETPEEFWERARVGARVPPVDEWETWPFDGELTVRALAPPAKDEKQRHGADGIDCYRCTRDIADAIWHDERWLVAPLDKPSGLPVVVLLYPRAHVDFADLDDQLAAEFGPLLLRIHRAVGTVPGVGRVHIGRWGEGGEHCHIWFMGRPARMRQLSDSFAAIWDDILPPTPEDVWRENLEIVSRELEAS
jgi:diadenosine tetraphosphate (Ap4A) HIT family hydrolase